MGFQSKTYIFCLTFSLGSIALTIAHSSQKIENQSRSRISTEYQELGEPDKIVSKQLFPTILLPTEFLNPSHSNVNPVNLLPLDIQPLQVSLLEDKLEQSELNSESIVPNSNAQDDINKTLVDTDTLKVDETEHSQSDIILELNPNSNSSELEFLHANSTLKRFNPIPHFKAQILTLSYGGVKNPVLIVHPEMNKNKNSDGGEGGTSSSSSQVPFVEETSIPTFSIHFPLETNSQFQIPRYNFTLPTLFLPGLVFTQNENVKTNTHEVHVSFPHAYDKTQTFPPPLAQTEFELVSFNPKDSVGQQTSNSHTKPQKPQSDTVNEQPQQNHNEKNSNILKQSNYANIELGGVKETNKSPFKPVPVVSDQNNKTLGDELYPKTNSSKESNVVRNTTSPSRQKWKLPGLEKVYNNFFGTGRTEDCAKSTQFPDEDEQDGILCGSDGLSCDVTCHRLGFYVGKCTDESSCVCLLKQRPEFGIQLEYYADKKARNGEDIYPAQGLCHLSACKINCEREGYVTGFCDTTCFCGLPWAERTVK